MNKILKNVAITLVLFITIVILARIVTLLALGFSFITSLQNAATPLGTPIFWMCSGGLILLASLYSLRLLYMRYFLKRHSKSKIISITSIVFLGLVLSSWLGYHWIIKNDQKKEYNYEVPTFASKSKQSTFTEDAIIRGANVFGWEEVSEASFKNLENLGITSVTLMPFEYQVRADEPHINHIENLDDFRHKDSTFVKLTALCKSQNLTVVLKPHLFIESGWRDKFKYDTKEDWNTWFADYRKVILQYAKIAEVGGADILCIGTELYDSVKQQPEKWENLIKEIRAIYSGKLTYAANWDEEYREIPFWKQLDYIGVQSYFPMKVEGDATVASLKKALKPHIDTLSRFSRSVNKKVLFCEMGFRSIENNYQQPWAWPAFWDVFTRVYSEDSQVRAYDALFSSVFGQDWFAGGFIWEFDFNEDDGPQSVQHYNFSPRYKKTEQLIKEYYSKSYPVETPSGTSKIP